MHYWYVLQRLKCGSSNPSFEKSLNIKEIKGNYDFIVDSKINKRLKKMGENVIQNINSALKSIGRSRNKNDLDAHIEI